MIECETRANVVAANVISGLKERMILNMFLLYGTQILDELYDFEILWLLAYEFLVKSTVENF